MGFIDAGADGLPGLTFYTPKKSAVGGGQKHRESIRNEAYSVASSAKEDKSNPKIKSLAATIKQKKREALSRDKSLVFGNPKVPTPHESLARLLIAANLALKTVIAPAIAAHHCDLSQSESLALATPQSGGGGNKVTVESILDSGATDPMFDRVTAKQAKVPVDKAQSDNFSVAHGPDFETDGKITQPVHFELQSTDNEDMVLSIGKAHVADLGGSRGEAFAKNLVDIVRTLCFGMKLDVLLRLNEHGNWGGCIMDPRTGMMSRILLNKDMLPCLELKDAAKFPYASAPDSLKKLTEQYAHADRIRSARLGGRSFNTNVRSTLEIANEPAEPPTSEDIREWRASEGPLNEHKLNTLFNEWLDNEWEAEHQANKLSERSRMPAPRTIKTRMVYDSDSAHDLLHRSATETRKALNHPEVKFDPRDGSGKLKSGDELVDKDLEFGVCNVCKELRAVAPTRHAKGFLQYACQPCFGHSALASRRE